MNCNRRRTNAPRHNAAARPRVALAVAGREPANPVSLRTRGAEGAKHRSIADPGSRGPGRRPFARRVAGPRLRRWRQMSSMPSASGTPPSLPAASPPPPTLSGSSLRWAMGLFCSIIGAFMLVAPHQFSGPMYEPLRAFGTIWAAAALAAGVGLLSMATLRTRRAPRILAHGLASLVLLSLAAPPAAAGGRVRGGVLARGPRAL